MLPLISSWVGVREVPGSCEYPPTSLVWTPRVIQTLAVSQPSASWRPVGVRRQCWLSYGRIELVPGPTQHAMLTVHSLRFPLQMKIQNWELEAVFFSPIEQRSKFDISFLQHACLDWQALSRHVS